MLLSKALTLAGFDYICHYHDPREGVIGQIMYTCSVNRQDIIARAIYYLKRIYSVGHLKCQHMIWFAVTALVTGIRGSMALLAR